MNNKKDTSFYNLSDTILDIAQQFPEKLAFVYPFEITYNSFWQYIISLSNDFETKGIVKGIKTIVLLKPGVGLFTTVFALLRIGAIPVLIDPGMGVNNMLRSFKSIKPIAFIGTPKAMLLRVLGYSKLSEVRIWITARHVNRSMRNNSELFNVDNFKYKHKPDDNAAIFFTSGSTGPAKAVVYSNHMLTSQINILKNQFDYNSDDIDLCTFPLVTLLLLTLGITVAIADMNMLKPSQLKPSKIVSNINNLKCSSMFCSPMVLQKLSTYCVNNEVKLETLKKVLSSGAPVKPDLLSEFRNVISKDCKVYTPYGATEALPITNISDDDLLSRYDKNLSYLDGICVGKPLQGIDLKIIKIDDNPILSLNDMVICDENEIGEIIVSGGNVTHEYYKNNKASSFAKILGDDNIIYHRMGDLGRIDNDGYIWLYGRKSQRVNSNNKVYYTIPVEAVYNKHSKVRRSALVGIKGQEKQLIIPVICLELNGEYQELEKQEIISELKKMGSVYDETKDISSFICVKVFPVDPRHNAKIFREKLADIARKTIIQ